MLFCIYLSLCAWFLTNYISTASIVPWANPALELLDELHDAEIYKAVVSSMNEWQRKQDLKRNNNRIKRQDTSVCYPELGCFDASGPFGYLDMLPSKPEEIDTKFLLYPGHSRRRSGSPPAEIPFGNLQEAFEWAKQGFNKSLPTKVLIHGFGSGCTHIWVYEMRSALMAVEEINVICVDWENGAILPNYVKATANTRLVGKQLAMLLRGLVEHNGLSLKNTHLIGFSLGAHVAGFAGAEMGNLSRITGLDPAGPLFESQDPRARLDQTDADFVDVIHSNGENLILGGLGSYQPMGHVDFYPNGGRMQKGCSNLFVGAVSDIIWSSAVEGRSLCNHRRAYKFFTDSVSPRCHFPAFPCGSYEDFLAGKCFPCTEERKCGNMGYYADRSKGRGQLYLITRDEEPFCAHQYHVKIETSPSNVHIVSYGKIQITLIGDSTLNETFMMTRKEDEEMTLGQSISRILVPHPILAEPTRIQILYSAYSGWLSSGLTQWRIDKVTLSDSFGKTSSVCKKNLVLESGIPVNLPLYPGECNLPSDVLKEAQNRVHEVNKNITSNSLDNGKFKPTPVVKIGNEDIKNDSKQNKSSLSFRDAIEILNIPWRNDKENNIIDSESESSRAFNTRVIKASEFNQNLKDADGLVREIVEPILKPHSNKNARSHNLDKAKPEITEPILGPTTSKNFVGFKPEPVIRNDFFSKLNKDQKELTYNFYGNDEWAASPAEETPNDKYKREEKFQVITSLDDLKSPENPLDVIVTTVQFLPQRLARMFEEAEKYARETILPLVSTYTPKFITDIIAPKPQSKYVPLMFPGDRIKSTNRSIESRSVSNKTLSQTSGRHVNDNKPQVPSSPYTHIQKIRKKNDNIEFVFTETKSPDSEKVLPKDTNELEISRKARDDAHAKENVPKTPNIDKTTADSVFSFRKFIESVTQSSPKNVQNKENVTKKNPEAIYIDLPVFEEEKSIKYIPLSYSGSKN